MNILIVGANSFLASSIFSFHKKKKDNLFFLSRKADNKINIENFIDIKNLDTDFDKISKINFDIIYYMIAQDFIKRKQLDQHNSILYKLIPFFKLMKFDKFIYFSSISVYEGLKINNINNVKSTSPISKYAENKLYEENLIINELKNFDFLLLRIPMVIGRNMKSKIMYYLKLFLQKKLYNLIYNPESVINYITIDRLIYDINNNLKSFKNSNILNLSYNFEFSYLYKKNNIIIKKNFFNVFLNFIIKK